jgi:hypothetical protein
VAAVVTIPGITPASGGPASGVTISVEHKSGTSLPGFTGDGVLLTEETVTTDDTGEAVLSLNPCTGPLEGTIYVVDLGNRVVKLQPTTDGTWTLGTEASLEIIAPPGAPGVTWELGPPGEPGGPSLSGTLAARPAAASTDDNTLYFATDEGIAYHKPSADVWQQIAPPVDALDDQAELANGVGTVLDVSDPDFVGVDRHAERLFASSAVASTVAETSILLSTIDFAANTFANNNPEIFGQAWVSITNNTGSNRDMTYRIKLDGVTIYTVTLSAIATSASARLLSLRWSWVFGDFLGSSMPFGGCAYVLGAAGGGASTHNGVVGTAVVPHTLSNVLSFDITAQPSFSASTLSTQLQVGTLGLRSIS